MLENTGKSVECVLCHAMYVRARICIPTAAASKAKEGKTRACVGHHWVKRGWGINSGAVQRLQRFLWGM